MDNYFTYLVTYTFEESHSSIRTAFHDWLASNDCKGLDGIFCDESTYGIKSDKNVSEMQSILSQKLKEIYGDDKPASGDAVNLFCAALQADCNVLKDKSRKDKANTIYLYSIVNNGRFVF